MSSKLFVGGLAWSTTEETLRSAFEEVGEVESASIVTERDTGRSRGFGFVEMSDDEQAEKAIEALNGKELDGRAISVSVARPKRDA